MATDGTETNKRTIGIIGGGKSGHAMFRFLSKTNVARVVFVMDLNPSAPAMLAAQAEGIPVFTSLERALRKPFPDFVFEITSNAENFEKMKKCLKGTPTRIINQDTSRMIVELVQDDKERLQQDVSAAVLEAKTGLLTSLDASHGLVHRINQVMTSMQMLALNASIEAARLGHLGKGFAVVADSMTKSVESVRKLTQEIGDVNKNLVAASEQIDAVMEKLK